MIESALWVLSMLLAFWAGAGWSVRKAEHYRRTLMLQLDLNERLSEKVTDFFDDPMWKDIADAGRDGRLYIVPRHDDAKPSQWKH
jgi:hypothetical protein